MIKLLASVILMSYLFNCYQCGTLPALQQLEQNLTDSLLKGYNKNIRPDTQVVVYITAILQQIVGIDEKQQVMTSSSYIGQLWRDWRLSWNRSSYNNISILTLSVKSLWIPDTMILNAADDKGYLPVNDYSYATVFSNGFVFMLLPALAIKTKCNLHVQKFPFDKQVCSINFTSWSQTHDNIDYKEDDSDIIDISGYTEHSLWQLTGTDIIASHTTDRIPFEDTYNAVISIQLFLQRKPLYFIMNGVFACLILNVVTLLAFALPFGSQAGLCMTCFMTYSVYSLTFSNLFPTQSQYVMLITLYLMLSIGWTALTMAWFVIFNYYSSKDEMPKALYVFCGCLQRMCFCCFSSTKPNGKTDKNIDVIVETGEMRKTRDQNITGVIGREKTKCVSCRKLFAPCLRMCCRAKNVDKNQHISVPAVELIRASPADIRLIETPAYAIVPDANQKEKKNCDFCNRCESCQADVDKDKAKSKKKKDIEAKCNALNYFVFVYVFVGILVTDMALWLYMSQ